MPVLPLYPLRKGRCACPAGTRCRTPGKHPLAPLVPHGVRNATTDLVTVVRWWRAWPDANVGCATGYGFFALDVDPRHGGDTALAHLVAEHGALPQTVEASTGGGGQHFLFALPNGITTVSKITDGLETRGVGCLIVVEPSIHMSGRRYEWMPGRSPLDIPVAEAPRWLLRLAIAAPPRPVDLPDYHPQLLPVVERAAQYLAKCKPAISGQAGHNTTLLVAEHLVRGFELSERQALTLLRVWNQTCAPPWSERELAHKVHEAATRGRKIRIGQHLERRL